MNPFSSGRFAAVLFDLDGTLIDTAPDMVAVLQAMQQDHGRSPVSYELGRSYVSNGALGLLRLGFPEANDERIEALRPEFLSRYLDRISEASTLFPGMDRLVACLRERLPCSTHVALLHNDFKLDNLLLDADDPNRRSVGSFFVNPVLGAEALAALGEQMVPGETFDLWLEPGVFAKQGIDPGSALLLKWVPRLADEGRGQLIADATARARAAAPGLTTPSCSHKARGRSRRHSVTMASTCCGARNTSTISTLSPILRSEERFSRNAETEKGSRMPSSA